MFTKNFFSVTVREVAPGLLKPKHLTTSTCNSIKTKRNFTGYNTRIRPATSLFIRSYVTWGNDGKLKECFSSSRKFLNNKHTTALHTDANQNKCWNCDAPLNPDGLFCSNCSVLKDPSLLGKDFNNFKLLDVPIDFEINEKELEKTFWKLQMKLHPDKFEQSLDQEKEFSADLSSKINHAYNILKSPIHR